MTTAAEVHILDQLYEIVLARRDDDPDQSYTARLYVRGVEKIAQKLGEEAVETVIEAVAGEREALAAESADLLYHLVVLWAARDLTPAEVWAVLAQRRGVSGLEEKAARELPPTGRGDGPA